MDAGIQLCPYSSADEDAAIELWRRTWQHHFPQIDFNERVAWWRERWKQELVPIADVWQQVIGGTCPTTESTLSLTPMRNGTDGFFVAVMERQKTASSAEETPEPAVNGGEA